VRVGLKARCPYSDSTEVIAHNAAVRVTFNPRAVSQYRLIGFEKKGIRSEAAAKGATIAAGYEVTALYEVRLARNSDDARLLDVRLLYDSAAPTGDGIVPGPQATPTEVIASLSSADLTHMFAMAPARFRLAVAAAEFGEILRGVPWTRGID
jgi:Ca-activated chloride channel family protein